MGPSLIDYLDRNATAVKPAKFPAAWKAGVQFDGRKDKGVITSRPVRQGETPEWKELFSQFGLDGEAFDVDPTSIKFHAKEQINADGEVEYVTVWKADINRRKVELGWNAVDSEIAAARKRNSTARSTVAAGPLERSIVVGLSDWQMGNGEGGGSARIVERVVRATDELVEMLKAEKKKGRTPETIVLAGLGDLVENCSGFYSMQTYSVDLNNREQMTVSRRLIIDIAKRVAPYAPHIVLASVPGNHGEERDSNGKAYTDWSDNRDLAVFEQAYEVLQAGGYNVSAQLADRLDMVLQVSGVGVTMIHGHQSKGRPENWYARQASRPERTDIYQSSFLFCGHKHHLDITETDHGRTVISCPSMDGGSEWFSSTNGASSQPGMIALSVGKAHGARGWGDLVILGSNTHA